jgi:hypothetical protein
MIKITPRYEDNLFYPMVIHVNGVTRIVEMSGRQINALNDADRSRGCQCPNKCRWAVIY